MRPLGLPRSRLAVSSVALLALGGCHTGWSERTTGAVVGGAGGAVVGGLLGSSVGSTATGAVLGAAAGAAAGYIIGDYLADRRERSAMASGSASDGGSEPAGSASEPGPAVPSEVETVGARRAAPSTSPYDRDAVAHREYDAGRDSKTDAEALAHYNAAMRAAPSRPEPHNARGLVLLHMGRNEDARRAFQQAVLVDPSYAPARANLDRLAASTR